MREASRAGDWRPAREPSETLRFNRRGAARRQAEGSLTAIFRDGNSRTALAPVELIDISPGGLGLRSTVAVGHGARVALTGGSTCPTWTATVVRCEPEDGGYRLGVCCDTSIAA